MQTIRLYSRSLSQGMSQTRRRLCDYRINLQNPALRITLKAVAEIGIIVLTSKAYPDS